MEQVNRFAAPAPSPDFREAAAYHPACHPIETALDTVFKSGELAEAAHRRLERAKGNFSRTFTLPQTVDVENIRADLKSGVLTLTLAKKPEAQPRQIKVTLSS